MSKLKTGVFKTALALCIVLIMCTLLSKTIYNLMLPEVKKEVVSKGHLNIENSDGTYTLVPLNCIYFDGSDYFIFKLEENETLWGKEQIVRRIDVELLGSDYTNGAVNVNNISMVVSSTAKALYDGANVKVAQ